MNMGTGIKYRRKGWPIGVRLEKIECLLKN